MLRTYINRNLYKQIITAQSFMAVLRPHMHPTHCFDSLYLHQEGSCRFTDFVVIVLSMSALLRRNSMLPASRLV